MRKIIALSLYSLIVIGGCSPPLKIEQHSGLIKFSAATLGEYPTPVSHIRLSDLVNDKVVWELIAETGSPQIWGFDLRLGENPPIIQNVIGGKYKILKPESKGPFTLRKDSNYKLEIWNESGFRSAAAEFRFGR